MSSQSLALSCVGSRLQCLEILSTAQNSRRVSSSLHFFFDFSILWLACNSASVFSRLYISSASSCLITLSNSSTFFVAKLHESSSQSFSPVSYTHLTLPTTPYV
eukprot:TRINITY_DN1154_c0_g1_i40.p1 TRINITY_DN1154_c0_g1~~TRINITY_DN1154_c0_g1_i40.p1  ORF type:complete len:104 (-),score=4.04 TRINITY_DN1154_c0_g1_i40:46-357(-)